MKLGSTHSMNRTKSGKYLPQTFAGKVFNAEERELGDSFLRRKMWSKSYVNLQKVRSNCTCNNSSNTNYLNY